MRGILTAALFVLAACGRPPLPTEVRGNRIELPAGEFEIAAEIPVRGPAEIFGRGTVLRLAANFQGRALFTVKDSGRVVFRDFTIDGNRDALEKRQGLPGSDVPFAEFTRGNGIWLDGATEVEIRHVTFRRIAGFALLARAAKHVTVDRVRVEDSGSRNEKGRNNSTGGLLFEEGADDFEVRDSGFERIRGNGLWTHSLYTSPRNSRGRFLRNTFAFIGRDALQAGHATEMRIEGNTGHDIGFPMDDVDVEGRAYPVAIDTAGNVERSVYRGNRFEEINGKCIDLDGFHHGEVRGNACVNRRPPEQYKLGNFGIVMNNTNPDMKPEGVVIAENVIDGPHFGGVFVIGSGNRVVNNRLLNLNRAHCNEEAVRFGCYHAPGEPDMLRSGIYLGKGAERPAPAHGNLLENNEITGFRMRERCIAAAPGVSLPANRVRGNTCR